MIESLPTTQIAFFRFATPCGFFRESGDEVQKVSVQGSVQGKIIWNHFWEHRFLVPDPRVFPPPGGRFSPQTTENQIYDWACRAAQQLVRRAFSSFIEEGDDEKVQYASFKNTSSSNGCLCLTCLIVSKSIIDSVHCDDINLVGGRRGLLPYIN